MICLGKKQPLAQSGCNQLYFTKQLQRLTGGFLLRLALGVSLSLAYHVGIESYLYLEHLIVIGSAFSHRDVLGLPSAY